MITPANGFDIRKSKIVNVETMDIEQLWERELVRAQCDFCDWGYLVPTARLGQACPHCHQYALEPIEDDAAALVAPPELVVEFTLDEAGLRNAIDQFDASYRFTPDDVSAETLLQRMQPIFLPVWLVDVDLETKWQAEMGFNYKVVSHAEQYRAGNWETEEKQETRVRWEPRLGSLTRHYANVRAAALEEHDEVIGGLGKFNRFQADAYDPELIDGAFVCLPDRETADALNDAVPTLLKSAEKDCIKASGANHVRDFHWSPSFNNQHWTKLLLPVFSTFYFDDDGKHIPLLINGRSGVVLGEKRASMKTARRMMGWLLAIAAVLFLVGAILAFSGAAGYTSVLLILAVMLGVGAFGPVLYARQINANTSRETVR